MFGFTTEAKAITQDEAVELFNALDNRGMVPVSVTYCGKYASRKADSEKFTLPGYSGKGGEAYFAKFSQINGNLGLNYEDKVNRQREKEGVTPDFVAEASAYDYESKAIRSKGDQKYLYYFPRFDGDENYYVKKEGGKFETVEFDDVSKFVTPRAESASNKQGIEKTVDLKTISLGSIVAFTLDKQAYVISDIDSVRREIIEAVIGEELWY